MYIGSQPVINQQLFLGIDGGGTKCKARLEDAQGRLLGEGLAGPANPVRGVAQTIESILSATELAIIEAKIDVKQISNINAGLGLAGVNLPSSFQSVQKWQHPFANMSLTTDLHIACLGAHDGQDGAVIITGTGFSAGSMIGENHLEIGGHGFVLGDSGSGAKLGASSIRRALEYLDGIAPGSSFIEAVLKQLECSDSVSVVEKTITAKPAFYAQFAPLVLEFANQGDPIATELVNIAANYISRIARRLLANNPPRLAMIGGISTPIGKWLDEDIQEQLSAPLQPPEVGAILFARQQFSK
jgi:glucosamine kinase